MPKIEDTVHKYLDEGRSWYQRKLTDITKIVVHHSAAKQDGRQTNESVLRLIQGWHSAKGWPGLSYHFVIMPDGTIFQTNNFSDITWHDGTNNNSLGILVHGYFHPDVNEHPTQKQLASLKELLDWLCTENPNFPADQDDVYGHRDIMATACPGNNLYPYVVDYREKLGQVSWDTESESECEKKLTDMTINKEEWKAKAREREKELEKKDEEIKELNEQIDRAKELCLTLEELANNKGELIAKRETEIKVLEEEIFEVRLQVESALESILRLTNEKKALQKQIQGGDFTLSDILQIIGEFINKKLSGKKVSS